MAGLEYVGWVGWVGGGHLGNLDRDKERDIGMEQLRAGWGVFGGGIPQLNYY